MALTDGLLQAPESAQRFPTAPACGPVSATATSTGAGNITGTIDLGDADFKFCGESPSDLAGSSVSTAGDVNGDGCDELLVGALGNDEGGSDAGKADLILSELE